MTVRIEYDRRGFDGYLGNVDTAEQIIGLLREAEVRVGQRETIWGIYNNMAFIFCTGMPRSGSTWSYNICRLLIEASADAHRLNAGYWGEGAALDKELAAHDPDLVNLVKTHHPSDTVVDMINAGRAVAIHTYRDPYQAIASVMHFFNRSIEDAVSGIGRSIGLATHLFRSPSSYFIDLESILHRPRESIEGLLEHLASQTDLAMSNILDETILDVLDMTSLERVRALSNSEKFSSRNDLAAAGRSRYDPVNLYHIGHIRDHKLGGQRYALTSDEQSYAEDKLQQVLDEWLLLISKPKNN